MSGRIGLRLAASSGAAAVLLLIVGNEVSKIVGGSPALHDPAEAYIRGILGADQTPVLTGNILIVVGQLLFLPFFLALRRLLETRREQLLPSLLTGAGTVTVTIGLTGTIPLVPLSVLAADQELTPEIAKALTVANAASWVLSWATSSVWVAATAALILRSRVLPHFLGWIGALLAPALLIGAALVWVVEAFTLAWLLTILWTLILSLITTIRVGAIRPIAAGPPGLSDPAFG